MFRTEYKANRNVIRGTIGDWEIRGVVPPRIGGALLRVGVLADQSWAPERVVDADVCAEIC